MKNIVITAILTVLVTLAFLKIFFCSPCKNICCLDHNDSVAIYKGYLKNDRTKLGPHHRPHDGGLATLQHHMHNGTTNDNKDNKDVVTTGRQVPGTTPIYQVTQTSPSRSQGTVVFNSPDVWRTTSSSAPNPYSVAIDQKAIDNLLANYTNDPYEDQDADYFFFDAATIFNFIYSSNSSGHVIQDLIFELGRDPANNNRLTLIISGLDNTLNLVPINGDATKAFENCYPCPQCNVN